ncbi:hypothetical protein MASR1M6_00200 [Rubrivivax sp.]
MYAGTLSGGSSPDFQMIVLENNEFWVMYGMYNSTAFQAAGFIQGAGASGNGSFSVASMRDYGMYPPLVGSASGTYNAGAKTISGTTVFSGRTVRLSGGPIVGGTYDYGAPASISTVAGNWTVGLSSGETASLTVGTSGSVTMRSSGGCLSTGTVTPRPTGTNVFNVSVTFGYPPCLLPGMTVSGVAIAYPLANGRTQLLAAARDSAQSAGFLAAGAR